MKHHPIVLYRSKSKALIALERKQYLMKTIAIGNKGIIYTCIAFVFFLLGLSPVLFNYVIDPYNFNSVFDLGINKEKLSLKSHYPLWKMSNFPEENVSKVILGDSRALALKDKYWQQLKINDAYNFAYGGATIREVLATADYLKQYPNVKTLFIGIQLRSFSPLFKKGMNRVPEAIELTQQPIQYYASGFVTGMSWKHVGIHYKKQFEQIKKYTYKLDMFSVPSAHAGSLDQKLDKLLDPKHCTNCILPQVLKSQPLPQPAIVRPKVSSNLGLWQNLWPAISLDRELPAAFGLQVTKNARSDWQAFTFSNHYWQGIKDIASWSKQNNVELIFFIPPTIAEMQQQITNYGYAVANQELRENLAQLAPVVDFDFDSPLTRNIDNFNDAYHFNHKVAKAIIGELSLLTETSNESIDLIKKRRSQVICPTEQENITHRLSDDRVVVLEGKSCRIWRANNE